QHRRQRSAHGGGLAAPPHEPRLKNRRTGRDGLWFLRSVCAYQSGWWTPIPPGAVSRPSSRRPVMSRRANGARSSSGSAAATLRLALAQEFRTLASIRHPHVISVLDYGFESAERPFFTMELLEGARPMLDAAAGHGVPQRVRMLLQVLQALTYVHRRGVLH